jgi:hypothetical protein
MSAPRVFISYAQDSPEHSARVLELAEALRQHGIDADLDQLHRHELLDWPRWCQEQLRPERSDWVLTLCSEVYRDRIETRVDPHTGKGAFWEGALIDDQLYQAKGNRRFVPVLLAHVPEIGWAVHALSKEARLILLLDGLNEVPTAKREAKAAELLAFKDGLAKGTPCIVSCRRDDYVGDLDLGLDTLSLEPLTPRRIRQVLRHWLPDDAEGFQPGSAERLFWQLAGDERLARMLETWLAAGADEEDFWLPPDLRYQKPTASVMRYKDYRIWRQHILDPRSLLRLAANPFMLTMLYQVWAFDGELPRNRGDLFTRFVDRLLSRERLLVRNGVTGVWEATIDGERLLSGLTDLAWIVQGERAIWQRRFWEHTIRDDRDFERHLDYIHYNPSNMGMLTVSRTGRIPASTAMFGEVFFFRTGRRTGMFRSWRWSKPLRGDRRRDALRFPALRPTPSHWPEKPLSNMCLR